MWRVCFALHSSSVFLGGMQEVFAEGSRSPRAPALQHPPSAFPEQKLEQSHPSLPNSNSWKCPGVTFAVPAGHCCSAGPTAAWPRPHLGLEELPSPSCACVWFMALEMFLLLSAYGRRIRLPIPPGWRSWSLQAAAGASLDARDTWAGFLTVASRKGGRHNCVGFICVFHEQKQNLPAERLFFSSFHLLRSHLLRYFHERSQRMLKT